MNGDQVVDLVITVGCPWCGAQPGEACRDDEGNPVRGAVKHKERVFAWRDEPHAVSMGDD